MTIREYLLSAGYRVPDSEYYADVDEWLSWYKGDQTDFHKYTIYNGKNHISQYHRRLYMAKQICEDWANLLMTENVSVTVGGMWQERLDEILHANNFQARANQLVELNPVYYREYVHCGGCSVCVGGIFEICPQYPRLDDSLYPDRHWHCFWGSADWDPPGDFGGGTLCWRCGSGKSDG